MIYPRYGYAIFPYDENGDIAGVYVGSSCNVTKRVNGHMATKTNNDAQKELHELMRKNGYGVVELYVAYKRNDSFKEYMWMDIFIKYSKYKVFNKVKGCYPYSKVAKVYKKYFGTPCTQPGRKSTKKQVTI